MFEPVSSRDLEILRALAARQAEIAARPEQQRKADLWTRHNDLQTDEPVVFIDPEIGWREIITPESLECEGELAREWETLLRKNIFWGDQLRDDKVIDDVWTVPQVYSDTGWGLTPTFTGKVVGQAYHIDGVLEDYETDFEKVHFPELIFDDEGSARLWQEAERVFGGILKLKSYDAYWWSLGLTWSYIDLRGYEDFLCDFVAEPEWIHRMMDMLCEGTLKKLDTLERLGKLRSNAGNAYVGSGGFGFTRDLPAEPYPGAPVKARDMWGFVESQETTSVSPDMYGEFIYPYHEKIAARFGLNCYGCCEPFEPRWKYVKNLPRLRRVSVSPWANRAHAMELLGRDYIASHKLPPMPLSLPDMDENLVRSQIREALEVSRGCVCELIMKDNTTLGKNPQNAIRWVQLVREEIDRIGG